MRQLVAAAGFLAAFVSAGSSSAPVRLIEVSADPDAERVAVLIRASEPVAYVTHRPNPLTLLVDLRNVNAAGAAVRFKHGFRTPITAILLQDTTAQDGTAIARVRFELSSPVAHRIASHRSTITVEFDRSAAAQAASRSGRATQATTARAAAPQTRPTRAAEAGRAVPAPARGATVISAILAETDARGTVVTLRGNGRLEPAGVAVARDTPPRLILDFPDLSPGVPSVTLVRRGPVERIRVAVNTRQPLVTRVVIDLNRPAQYTVEPPESDERDLRVVFDNATEPAGAASGAAPPAAPVGVVEIDPMAALRMRPPPSPMASASQGLPSPPAAPAGQALSPASASQVAPAGAPLPPAVEQAPATVSLTPAASMPVDTAPASQTPPVPQPTPPPPPPQTPPAPSGTVTLGERQYQGHPVSLDFQGVDLRAVLRTFAEISGLNIVIDPAVQGTVDVALRDVPWDQALDIILRANKLGYTVEGTIVRIAPLTVLAEEEGQRRKLAEEQALSGELRVLTRTLSYAKAADLASLLTRSVLSQRGQVQVDVRTNTLIITDLQDRLDAAGNLLGTLDRPEPQVEIEARIVQTTREFARSLGVQWGVVGRVAPELGNTTGLAFPNRGGLTGRTGASNTPQDPRAGDFETSGTAINLPAANATSAIGLALGAVNGSFNLDLALSALERSGRGRVLSTPRVSTQNNNEAEVKQGIQIPIQTIANNTVTVSFKDAALILRVTPQITSANTVIMRIVLENATPDFSRQVNGIPPINTQSANTQVLVTDGATTVIGGIFVSSEQSSNDRTPGLHRIPLLGWLFKRDTIQDESRELLIFITPRIIKG